MKKTGTETKRKETIAVIGLGYVGLPLAVRAVERGYDVIGIARSKEKIAMINKGISPIEDAGLSADMKKFPVKATDDPKTIGKADIVLLCVPTPVDELHNPDLTPVRELAALPPAAVLERLERGLTLLPHRAP